jgi:hypothetical protein
MRYFTLENSVQDFAYFAQNVELPFTNGTRAAPPPQTAWIVTGESRRDTSTTLSESHGGGSYPGALAAYVKQTFPDLFYAAYGSSAPVQASSLDRLLVRS